MDPYHWIIGLHLLSAHAQPGMESVTPGVYAISPAGATFGAYRNSLGRQTAYAGWTWRRELGKVEGSISLVGATGYRRIEGQDQCRPKYKHSRDVPCYKGFGADVSPMLSFGAKVGMVRLSVAAGRIPVAHLSVEAEL